jgi:hypothetical protein
MPTIKLTAAGNVITKGGLPSCTCCACCDYEVLEIGAFIVAGPGDTGYFTIVNNCDTDITVTSYNGVGSSNAPVPPWVIPANTSSNRLIFFLGGAWESSSFTLTIEGCGVSATYYWPPDYTGSPSWL